MKTLHLTDGPPWRRSHTNYQYKSIVDILTLVNLKFVWISAVVNPKIISLRFVFPERLHSLKNKPSLWLGLFLTQEYNV